MSTEGEVEGGGAGGEAGEGEGAGVMIGGGILPDMYFLIGSV